MGACLLVQMACSEHIEAKEVEVNVIFKSLHWLPIKFSKLHLEFKIFISRTAINPTWTNWPYYFNEGYCLSHVKPVVSNSIGLFNL